MQECCNIAGIAILANCIAIRIACQVSRCIDSSMNRADTITHDTQYNFFSRYRLDCIISILNYKTGPLADLGMLFIILH